MKASPVFGIVRRHAVRQCSMDMNSARSSALKAHVSTTCVPWVLMTRSDCPFDRRAALPRRVSHRQAVSDENVQQRGAALQHEADSVVAAALRLNQLVQMHVRLRCLLAQPLARRVVRVRGRSVDPLAVVLRDDAGDSRDEFRRWSVRAKGG